jgi:5-methylcytosine-specific restriction endonuclease McrA
MSKVLIIKLDECFECGAPKEEMHHIIPKSRGGIKTIPLCIDCHGKAHNISHRRLFMEAAKIGRDKYIENGGKLGRKEGSIKDDEKLISEHSDVVKYLRQGQSIRNTMKLTGKSSGTVQKIKKLII